MHNITENMIPGTVQKRGRGKPQVQGQNNMGKMATNLWNGGQLFSAKLKVEKLIFLAIWTQKHDKPYCHCINMFFGTDESSNGYCEPTRWPSSSLADSQVGLCQ